MVNSNEKKRVRSVKYPAWTEDAERLVLYIDIMGFSARVLSKKHSEVKLDLLNFKSAWERRMQPLLKGGYLEFVQFSDSILIVANGVSPSRSTYFRFRKFVVPLQRFLKPNLFVL